MDKEIDKTKYEDVEVYDSKEKQPKKGHKFNVIVVVLCIVFATNILTGTIIYNVSSNRSKRAISDNVEFGELYNVKSAIDEYYVDDYDKDKLVEGAIKGMITAIGDPYTEFMNKEELKAWNSDVSGKYVGIGIQIGTNEDNEIVVISPIKGTPSERAGIKSGDVLVKVNELLITKNSLSDALAIMKTKENEKINLVLNRDGKEFSKVLITEEIKIQSVFSEMLDSDIGYIELTTFDDECSDDFEKALKELKAKKAKGIVLDLRGNPGGYVSECINIVSNFLPKGDIVVYTEDKAEKKTKYRSKGGDYEDMPLVVLVDGGSASASEIFSGAMRDYNRATLIGTKTFGKGKVQVILNDDIIGTTKGIGLKVTISYYYSPNGENIDKKGIEPNINIEYKEPAENEAYSKKKDNQLSKATEVLKEKIREK